MWGEKGSPVNCGFFFCDITSEMSFDQVATVKIYNFLCVIVFAVVFGYILLLNVWESFFSFFVERDAEATVGETSTKEFYEISGANAYVPHIELPMQEPVLFVDFSNQVSEDGAKGSNTEHALSAALLALNSQPIAFLVSVQYCTPTSAYFSLGSKNLDVKLPTYQGLKHSPTTRQSTSQTLKPEPGTANPNRFECF